jgi:hypothetical protein
VQLAAPLVEPRELDLAPQRRQLVAPRAPRLHQLDQDLAAVRQLAARGAHQRTHRPHLVRHAAGVAVAGGLLGLVEDRLRLAQPPLGHQARGPPGLDQRQERRVAAGSAERPAERRPGRRHRAAPLLDQRQRQVQPGACFLAQAGVERRVDELSRMRQLTALGLDLGEQRRGAGAEVAAAVQAMELVTRCAHLAGAEVELGARHRILRPARLEGGRDLAAPGGDRRAQPAERRRRPADEPDEADDLAARRPLDGDLGALAEETDRRLAITRRAHVADGGAQPIDRIARAKGTVVGGAAQDQRGGGPLELGAPLGR